MNLGLILFLAWTALEVVVVVGSIVWSIEQGQWKNIEEAKFRMLIDHDLAPWPGREKPNSEVLQENQLMK